MNESYIELEGTKETTKTISIQKIIYPYVKRFFDIIFGLIGCIFIIPLAIIIKIAYMVSGDFAPIFYHQTRVGKNGKEFKMYKFRTMVPNADKELKELLKNPKYHDEWNKNQKLGHDPRITKIGHVLRKCSIDEFPQFISLLTGNMSLVGPRPLVKGEIEKHHGDAKVYEAVRPGITGWWAVNGRSAITYEKRLELEYYYVKHCSLLLDLKTILKTFQIIWTHEGAK
jgi:lipopolysaccharide/colanic/teichoic acid biosynthesis glycosyltransferase